MKPKLYLVLFITLLLFSFSATHSAYSVDTGALAVGVADKTVELPAQLYVYGASPSNINFAFADVIEPPYPYVLELVPGYYRVTVNYTKLDGRLGTASLSSVPITVGETSVFAVGSYSFTTLPDGDGDGVGLIEPMVWTWLSDILLRFWWLLLLLLVLLAVLLDRRKKNKP